MDLVAEAELVRVARRHPRLRDIVLIRVREQADIFPAYRHTPIAVIEAMKMETAVNSPVDGKIEEVHVKKGDSVEANDLVVVFA